MILAAAAITAVPYASCPGKTSLPENLLLQLCLRCGRAICLR